MSQRTDRVQKLAREVLGEAIQNLKDPRVGFATVTAVRVTPDLRHAKVYVSVLGDDQDKRATMAGLESARSYLRSVLGHEIRTKYLPDLHFELDEVEEQAQHLEEIFHRIHEQEGPAPAAERGTTSAGTTEDAPEVEAPAGADEPGGSS